MSESPISSISENELLGRFLTKDFWVRADQTISPDAFIPPKDLNLSVTRHVGLTEEVLWRIAQNVADAVSRRSPGSLHGRADIAALAAIQHSLQVEAAPLPDNANHAHINGWPQDNKPAQKQIAQRIAAAAKFVAKP